MGIGLFRFRRVGGTRSIMQQLTHMDARNGLNPDDLSECTPGGVMILCISMHLGASCFLLSQKAHVFACYFGFVEIRARMYDGVFPSCA